MAMTIWGREAAGGPYAAIAALTNIPATLLAFFIYDTFLCSSSRSTSLAFSPGGAKQEADGNPRRFSIALTPQHDVFLRAHKLYHEDNGLVPSGFLPAIEPHHDTTSLESLDGKPVDNTLTESAARNV